MKLNPISDERLSRLLQHEGVDRAFLSNAPLRLERNVEGVEGLVLTVRLTSYRALPLSCIEAIELTVDGVAVDVGGATLRLGGLSHPLTSLASLTTVWWFILDEAELFVPKPNGLSAGDHEISGTLTTVEPYITAGRFSFRNSSTRLFNLAA